MRKSVLAAVLVTVGCSAWAETSITDVIARQRWPWNGVVDIDYTLSGEASDVKFMATWEGQAEPTDITRDVQGLINMVECGAHHAVWDPSSVANGELRGVSVSIVPVDGNVERKYLVIDLMNGGYEFMSSVPEGGWDETYRKTKMAFVRIPAATYNVGLTEEQMNAVWPDGGKYADFQSPNIRAAKARQVKISNAYYMSVYMFTVANNYAVNGVVSGTAIPQYATTDTIRGVLEDACWPQMGHKVAEKTSVIGKIRAKARLPKGWLVDLPTATQFEIAARCGMSSPFPTDAISAESTEDEVLAYVNSIAWWKRHQPVDNGYAQNTDAPVGVLAPNPWGLYDMIGFRSQLTLDWNNGSYERSDYSVDPVGPLSSGDNNRMVRSIDTNPANTVTFAQLFPSRGGSYVKQTNTSCFRLCVDTRSLIETTSDEIK